LDDLWPGEGLADAREMTYGRQLELVRLDRRVDIDQIHGGHDVAVQGDLGDLRLGSHRIGDGYGAVIGREFGLSAEQEAGGEEPAAHPNMPASPGPQRTERL